MEGVNDCCRIRRQEVISMWYDFVKEIDVIKKAKCYITQIMPVSISTIFFVPA